MHGCLSEQNIAHQTREQKKQFKFSIKRMAYKFYQTRSKSINQGVQTVKCLVTKQCLMVFGRQTFPVYPGPYLYFTSLARSSRKEKPAIF